MFAPDLTWNWWYPFFLGLYYSPVMLWLYYASILFAGTLIGASLGSYRRNYWSRWQCGAFVGAWLGAESSLVAWFMTHEILRLERPILGLFRLELSLWIGSLAGLIAAGVGSVLAARWLQQTESYWGRYFRDHPWCWTRSRFLRLITALTTVCLLGLWIRTSLTTIDHFQEVMPHLEQYFATERQWAPYGVTAIDQLGDRLQLIIHARKAFSPPAIALLDGVASPLEEVWIQPWSEASDENLVAVAPHWSTLKILRIWDVPIKSQGLMALKQCEQLQELHLQSCPMITSRDVTEFESARPDVEVMYVP